MAGRSRPMPCSGSWRPAPGAISSGRSGCRATPGRPPGTWPGTASASSTWAVSPASRRRRRDQVLRQHRRSRPGRRGGGPGGRARPVPRRRPVRLRVLADAAGLPPGDGAARRRRPGVRLAGVQRGGGELQVLRRRHADLAEIRPGDCLLDVLVMAGPKSDAFTTLPKVYSGTHLPHRNIAELRARRVDVETDWPFPVEADGEMLGTTPASFGIIPSGVPPEGMSRRDASRVVSRVLRTNTSSSVRAISRLRARATSTPRTGRVPTTGSPNDRFLLIRWTPRASRRRSAAPAGRPPAAAGPAGPPRPGPAARPRPATRAARAGCSGSGTARHPQAPHPPSAATTRSTRSSAMAR